jgi:hypothetical protein
MKSNFLGCAAVLCLCAAGAVGAQDCRVGNPLVDPGFETQIPFGLPWHSGTGWDLFGSAFFSNNYARSGQGSMLIADPSWQGGGSYEQFPAAPGSKWRLKGYGYTPVQLDPGPFGFVMVSFFDIYGRDLGTVETSGQGAKTSALIDSTTVPGTWKPLDTGTATAPDRTAFVQAFTLSAGAPQGMYFDDLGLTILGVNHGQYLASIAANARALNQAGAISDTQEQAMVSSAKGLRVGKGNCGAN